ncbi:putative trna-dihydrouridine synthase [Fasciolopsis buskii]|uniref:Putative trna-dihydrouridine synthase n=1 Tax=Fasciolopsis buskii TaxID=27845 RepID=A0A8E0RRM9_9TREM|nr:putative trna-dihydrouridine synthase [Fasciolopsis buski]
MCKIRILPELEDTIRLVRLIESTGVVAITVHGRTIQERPQHRNHDEVIREIAKAVSIPVIANGGSKDTISKYEDIEFFRRQTGASSVMIARAAMWYPAIFRPPNEKEEPPMLHDVIREYLILAVRFGHHTNGVKYCIQQMLHREGDTPLFLDTLAAVDMNQLCSTWGVLDRCRELSFSSLKSHRVDDTNPLRYFEPPEKKRARLDGNERDPASVQSITRHIPFERRYWPVHGITPKQVLIAYCQKQKMKPPEFHTVRSQIRVRRRATGYPSVLFHRHSERHSVSKHIRASCFTANYRFIAQFLDYDINLYHIYRCKSKKFSEQAVSLVCLEMLNIPDGRILTNI